MSSPRSDIREAAERVSASAVFARAERAKAVLRYVVEKADAGHPEDIKEYAIALEVFGRAQYDPKADSVVRVEASKLRGLLAKYYDGEGRDDPFRLDIPKGSYVPRLTANPLAGAPGEATPPAEASASAAPGAATPGDRAVPDGVTPAAGPAPGPPSAPPARRPQARRRVRPWFLAVAAVLLLAIGGMLAAARRPAQTWSRSGRQASVAVLPFADLSRGRDHQYLADGLTQELIGRLAELNTFRVSPRTSVMRYRERTDDVRTIGQELDVHAVLEGTVQVEGARVRISASLVDTRDGAPLWTRSFDRPLEDIFEIQRNVAEDVIKSFDVTHGTARRGMVRQRTTNLRAYQYYLRAAYLQGGGPDDLREMVEYYRAATEADPQYALAYAALSQALVTRTHWGFAPANETDAAAMAAAERAMALDPSLSESQHAMGNVHAVLRRDPARAEPYLRRAVELDSMNSDARNTYAQEVLIPLGRFDEAVEQLRSAVVVDPRENSLRNGLAAALLHAGRYEEAAEEASISLQFAPEAPGSRVTAGRIAFARGDVGQGLEHFRKAADTLRSSWVLGHLAWGLAKAGKEHDAREVLAEMAQRQFPNAEVDVAGALVALGDPDGALRLLDRAWRQRSSRLLALDRDIRFKALASDPRFLPLTRPVAEPGAAGS